MGSPIFRPPGASGSGTSDHSQLTNRTAANQHPASAIAPITTNFNKNLSSADDTVQKALETLDEIGIIWNNVTGTSQTAAANNGYIANNASLVTIILPTTAPVGSMVPVVGSGAGGWKIAQNANQQIVFGGVASTLGTGGYMASASRYESAFLVCIVADTIFSVVVASGNPDVV